MPKANADYAKMLRYAVADLEHYTNRLTITREALTELLLDLPERARVWQLIERHGINFADHVAAAAAVERYGRLVERQGAPDGATDGEAPPSEAPPAGDAPPAAPSAKRQK